MNFKCVQCPKSFLLERRWVDHLKREHGIAPVLLLDPTTADTSQVTKSGPTLSTPSTPSADNITPAPHEDLGPKVSFHVAYDLSQGDEVSPIRTTIPREESYENFLRRLRHVFYGDSFERSLRQWEYVLVNRQYKKGDPLLLTSSNTYYAMVSELLRPRSPWRYAVIRRSHSENPIIRAIAEGTFHSMPDPFVLDIQAPDTFLPDYPPTLDATQPDISNVDIPPVADPFQSDDSVAEVPIPAAPNDQAAPEPLVSAPPSEAWVTNTPSAEHLGRIRSPASPFKAKTQELSTTSTVVASAQDRRIVHLSSPLASAARARDPMQIHLPAISSPLLPSTAQRGRRLLRLSSPKTSISSTPSPSRLNPPPTSVACPQSLILSAPLPSAPAVSTESPNTEYLLSSAPSANRQDPSMIQSSTRPPAADVNRPPIEESSTSVMAASVRNDYVQVQSGITTLPTAGEQPPATSSSIQAPPRKPTPIFRPRRPLWIISRRHVNSGVEYQVHWNSGRNSWEPHDNFYRDYPALIDKFPEGRL